MRLAICASLAAVSMGGLSVTAPANAQDKACQLEISGNDALQFDKKEMKAPASCKEITVTLKHVGKLPATSMGHNWVLTRSQDLPGVVEEGMKAGPANQYVKPGDKRVIAATKVIGGGASTSVKFSTANLKAGEGYTFVCTFPGHSTIMRGVFSLS